VCVCVCVWVYLYIRAFIELPLCQVSMCMGTNHTFTMYLESGSNINIERFLTKLVHFCGRAIQVQYSDSFTGYNIKVSSKVVNPDKCTLSLYTECTTSYSTEPIQVPLNPYMVREAIGKHPHQCAHWWASIPTSCAYHNTRESSLELHTHKGISSRPRVELERYEESINSILSWAAVAGGSAHYRTVRWVVWEVWEESSQ
jgi:hypothetical protein